MTKESANTGLDVLLVIGYGNELRSDDGVGPKVAAAVAGWNSDRVRALSCHQLTPELAEPIAAAKQVIFVDATAAPSGSPQLRQLDPLGGGEVMTHFADPRWLLDLAKQVFGRSPPAWALAIPVENLDFGFELSSLARKGLNDALHKIQTMATQ